MIPIHPLVGAPCCLLLSLIWFDDCYSKHTFQGISMTAMCYVAALWVLGIYYEYRRGN